MVFLLGFSKAHKRLLKMIEYQVVSRMHLSKALFFPHKGSGSHHSEPGQAAAPGRAAGKGKGRAGTLCLRGQVLLQGREPLSAQTPLL